MNVKTKEEPFLLKFGGSWFSTLVPMIRSDYFEQLSSNVSYCYQQEQCFPEPKNLFRAFKATPFSMVKVVLLAQDPYPNYHANGVALATDQADIPQSLRLMFDHIQTTIGNVTTKPNLKHWTNQGVLMLNTRLSVANRKPGSHKGIGWEGFIEFCLHALASRGNVVFVSLGNEAKSILEPHQQVFVGNNNLVSHREHPAAAAYQKRSWNGDNLFQRINMGLTHLGYDQDNLIEW